MKIDIYQEMYTRDTSRFKGQLSFKVEASQFRRDEKTGHPYYHYKHSVKIEKLKVPQYWTSANIEMRFVPRGSKAELYKQVTTTADAQET